jgi:hypothetical protein
MGMFSSLCVRPQEDRQNLEKTWEGFSGEAK